MSYKAKPKHLNFNYSIGDIVVLDNGQYALITGYGIYDGQYWVEKYYGDGTVHLGGADYEFSEENTEAVKNRVAHISRLETDAEIRKTVITAYVKADTENADQFFKQYPQEYQRKMEHIQIFADMLNAI